MCALPTIPPICSGNIELGVAAAVPAKTSMMEMKMLLTEDN